MIKHISIVFLISFLFLTFQSNAAENKYEVKDGFINLSDYNFDEDGIISLRGKWKFFWNKFLDYNQIQSDTDFCYLKVPKSWKGQTFKNEILPKYGFGTYFLQVVIGEKYRNANFLIKSNYIPTSSSVFINDKLVGNNGKAAKSKDESVADIYFSLDEFIANSDTLNIVIHASNFHVEKAGVNYKFELGLAKTVKKSLEKQTAIDFFIIGSIFLMMLYYLVLYLLRKKEKSSLYFALTCFMILVYSICMTNVYSYLFQNLGFQFYYKLKHIAIYISFMSIYLYIYHIFKDGLSKVILKIIVITSLSFSVAMLILNSNINASIFPFYRYIGLLGVGYIVAMIIKLKIRKVDGAGIFIVGMLIIFFSMLNDTLYNMQIIKSVDILPAGLFLFLFLQTYLLSSRFNKSFIKNEELTEELTYINKNLEKLVEERTEKIAQQNHEIEEKNEELSQLLEEVTSQRDEIESQRDLVLEQKNKIELIHHELSQSIDYAKRIQSSILSDKSILNHRLADNFVLFRPKDKVSGDFYWWFEIENNLLVAAADCTGHGVPGGFMSMLGISFLREIIMKEYITHTGVILKRLRKEIINVLKQKGESGEQKDGMDMALININFETKIMQFSAANNPMYFIRNSELTEYKGDKMPIAIYERMDKFETTEIEILEGDQMYLFSDGFADQFGGENGKKFKYKPFKELLLANSHLPMKEQKTIIEQRFVEWCGELEQIDDVVVLGLKI